MNIQYVKKSSKNYSRFPENTALLFACDNVLHFVDCKFSKMSEVLLELFLLKICLPAGCRFLYR